METTCTSSHGTRLPMVLSQERASRLLYWRFWKGYFMLPAGPWMLIGGGGMNFTATSIRSASMFDSELSPGTPLSPLGIVHSSGRSKRREKRVPRLRLLVQRKCLAMHKGVVPFRHLYFPAMPRGVACTLCKRHSSMPLCWP